jgi:hypothetical protein
LWVWWLQEWIFGGDPLNSGSVAYSTVRQSYVWQYICGSVCVGMRVGMRVGVAIGVGTYEYELYTQL